MVPLLSIPSGTEIRAWRARREHVNRPHRPQRLHHPSHVTQVHLPRLVTVIGSVDAQGCCVVIQAHSDIEARRRQSTRTPPSATEQIHSHRHAFA